MSQENGNNQQQVQQPDAAKLPIVCNSCSQRFSVKIPRPEVFNNFFSSGIIMGHNNPIRCPKCHQAFIFTFAPQFQVQVVAAPVSDDVLEPDKRIIVPDMQPPKLTLM